jgi:hypothetical protein
MRAWRNHEIHEKGLHSSVGARLCEPQQRDNTNDRGNFPTRILFKLLRVTDPGLTLFGFSCIPCISWFQNNLSYWLFNRRKRKEHKEESAKECSARELFPCRFNRECTRISPDETNLKPYSIGVHSRSFAVEVPLAFEIPKFSAFSAVNPFASAIRC